MYFINAKLYAHYYKLEYPVYLRVVAFFGKKQKKGAYFDYGSKILVYDNKYVFELYRFFTRSNGDIQVVLENNETISLERFVDEL